jgi:hypothetical protein
VIGMPTGEDRARVRGVVLRGQDANLRVTDSRIQVPVFGHVVGTSARPGAIISVCFVARLPGSSRATSSLSTP